MSFHEFKRKMELLNNQEKEFIYSLTIEDAINFLKTIKIWERGKNVYYFICDCRCYTHFRIFNRYF